MSFNGAQIEKKMAEAVEYATNQPERPNLAHIASRFGVPLPRLLARFNVRLPMNAPNAYQGRFVPQFTNMPCS